MHNIFYYENCISIFFPSIWTLGSLLRCSSKNILISFCNFSPVKSLCDLHRFLHKEWWMNMNKSERKWSYKSSQLIVFVFNLQLFQVNDNVILYNLNIVTSEAQLSVPTFMFFKRVIISFFTLHGWTRIYTLG